MKRLYLDEYHPESELQVPVHIKTKAKFPCWDFHTHMGSLLLGDDYNVQYDTKEHINKLHELNIQGVVNLDGFFNSELTKMLTKTKECASNIINFMGIDFSTINDQDFVKKTEEEMIACYQQGARGVKLWKFISLGIKNNDGSYLRFDDERLAVIFATAAKLDIPILMHVGDPVAFFKAIDEKNERYEELQHNPDWSFSDESFFRFDELMAMQDAVIEKHQKTTFVVAHFGSYSENLHHVAKRLDKYPNMYIDTAARLAELGRQPYSSRAFFEKYQDRIVFGSDFSPLDDYQAYYPYFRFLETKDEYFDYQAPGEKPGQGRWKIYGIDLPDEILDKVYWKNAAKLLKL